MLAREPYGAGLAHCDVGRYLAAMQYFGSIGNPGDPIVSPFPAVETVRTKEWTAGANRARLWRVVSTVREVQRRSGNEVLVPLQTGTIERDGRDQTLLKLGVSVTGMGFDPRLFLIDVGSSLELWGEKVTVRWIAPPGVDEVAPGTTPATAVNQNIIDGLLGVQIVGIETPLTGGAHLTLHRTVGANAALAIPIPRGARDVTVYQTAAGAASIEWTWFYGDPNTVTPSWNLGALPFIAGQRRTDTISVVPGATHVVTDTAVLPRFFTIVWTIRP